MLEPARGRNVLDIVLSPQSQKECVDNVKICEPLGLVCNDHSQIQFIIKVKGQRNRKIRYMTFFTKEDIRT